MTATGVYVLLAVLAWPVLTAALAVKCNHLRRGPKLSTIAVAAAVLAVAWPLGLAVVYVLPSAGRAS